MRRWPRSAASSWSLHGRRVLCRRAALRLVLPRHRLRRHHPGRDLGAASAPLGAQDHGAVRRQCRRRACPGTSSRSRTRSRSGSARSSPSIYTVTNQAARADHRRGRLQRRAADGRRLFPEDQLLLLHRADAWSRARSARCRWCSTSIRRSPTDRENDGLNTITLSYTFYPRARAGAEAGGGERAGQAQGNSERRTDDLGIDCRANTCRMTAPNGETAMADGARQAPRLPPRRSEPVAGRRLDLGLRHGGRRDHLDASHVRRRADHLRRRRHRRALHHGRAGGAT